MYGKIDQHQAYTVICFGQLNVDNVTGSSQVTLTVKNLPTNAGDIEILVGSLGQQDLQEQEMTTCSSTLVLENSMYIGIRQVIIHEAAESQTLVSDEVRARAHTHTHIHTHLHTQCNVYQCPAEVLGVRFISSGYFLSPCQKIDCIPDKTTLQSSSQCKIDLEQNHGRPRKR